MGWAMCTTLFGSKLTLLGTFGKLAAPRLAIASETSGETLVPMVDMLGARGDWHKTSPSPGFYCCGFFRDCAIVNSGKKR